MMPICPHDEARRMLERAGADAQWLHVRKADGSPLDLEGYGFKAQQAIEKAIKAVLWQALGQAPPREHRLAKLALLLPTGLPPLPLSEDQLDAMYPFAVAFRYEAIPAEEMAFAPTLVEMQGMVAQTLAWADAVIGG